MLQTLLSEGITDEASVMMMDQPWRLGDVEMQSKSSNAVSEDPGIGLLMGICECMV